jgi:hypothetical protein
MVRTILLLYLSGLARPLVPEAAVEDPRDRFNRILQGFGFSSSRLEDTKSRTEQSFIEVVNNDAPLFASGGDNSKPVLARSGPQEGRVGSGVVQAWTKYYKDTNVGFS